MCPILETIFGCIELNDSWMVLKSGLTALMLVLRNDMTFFFKKKECYDATIVTFTNLKIG